MNIHTTQPSAPPTPPLHYYHEVKWRLLAEAPWLAVTLGLALILSSRSSFAPDTIPQIVTLGFLVPPMILLIASGDVDLSSGMLAGLVCQIVNFLHWQISLTMAILISLLVAFVVGVINGLLVGFARLKSVFVTLGMSYVLYGLILVWNILWIPPRPVDLAVLSQSPFTLLLWILFVIGCAAITISQSLKRDPRVDTPGPVPIVRSGPLSKGLLFVLSSFMAWISGLLLLGWHGYGTIASGAHYTETALLATLFGGTAYQAGTGFVLSGALALIDIVLFQQILHLPVAQENVLLGTLILIMLPIAQYYHVGVAWLYSRRSKKAKESLAAVPRQR